MTTLLQHLHDLVLVLGENFSETVGLLNEIVLSGSGETTVDELVGVVNLGTKSKHLASFLSNSNGVTSKHLNGETENLSLSDGGSGILTRGIEHGQHAEKSPWLVAFLDGNTEGTETTASELGGLGLVHIGIFLGAFREVKNGLGGTLGADESDTILDNDSSDTLGDRVERSEFLSLPALAEDFLGSWVALEGKNCDLVDGIQRLDVVGRGESGDSHHPVDILALGDERLANGQLIGSERSSLIGAENVDTGERFNGSELLHNGLLLGEISGSDSEGGGGDDGQTDGDTNNQENKSISEESVLAVFGSRYAEMVEETANPGDEDPADDQNQERRADRVHDGLEMALVLGTRNQRSSATDEGHLGGVGDNAVRLSTLATSCVVDDIGNVLVDGEGFTGHGRLINGQESVSGAVLLVSVLILLLLVGRVATLSLELLEVGLVSVGVVVRADDAGIGGDDLTIFDDNLHDAVISRGRAQLNARRVGFFNLQYHREPIRGP